MSEETVTIELVGGPSDGQVMTVPLAHQLEYYLVPISMTASQLIKANDEPA